MGKTDAVFIRWLRHLASGRNTAGLMTKPLDKTKFWKFVNGLGRMGRSDYAELFKELV